MEKLSQFWLRIMERWAHEAILYDVMEAEKEITDDEPKNLGATGEGLHPSTVFY